MSAPLAAFERPRSGTVNTVFKSGPLFISSKGLGWKNWKKRWFILTRTSLVFFKNDPTALPLKGGDVNLTLGGIDLNNSGSVVVREDKKLLTVLFPDGRDGRAFTLKAETSEDLHEWKTALEQALEHAPNAALVMGHNGIFHADANVAVEVSSPQLSDKRPAKSLVVGRPILLALEDIDGGPSFLEKALRFLETYGNNVEGILRLCANVAEVERRIQEYERGKNEFDPDEDAHVVGDCVKHVLRELPSSPVPAPCCTALLDACRMEKEAQTNAMRSAIQETFPEPNRRLLQRILKMMHVIASNSAENRMTSSSVATCMAPLLLRPLLAGDCELDDDFATNADNSAQLLAAANAANSAAAIVTNLLEEYENIFGGCSLSPDSQIENSGSDGSTVDGDQIRRDRGYHDAVNEGGRDKDIDSERALSGKLSESSDYSSSDLYGFKVSALRVDECEDQSDLDCASAANSKPLMDSPRLRQSTLESNGQVKCTTNMSENSTSANGTPVTPTGEPYKFMGEILSSMDPGPPLLASAAESCAPKPSRKLMGSSLGVKRSAFWGRSSARKTLSMESVDSSAEEELAIQKLESTKNDLRQRIAKEAQGNAILQASLERRKQALHERRLSLEQDVQRLQEQLQAERELRAALEVGLSMSSGQLSSSRSMDCKTRAELEEIALAEADVSRLKQKVAELHHQLNQQRQHHFGSLYDVYDRRFQQRDFDSTLAFCNHERKQRYEEGHCGPEWRKMKGQAFAGVTPSRNQFAEPTSFSIASNPEAYGSCPMDDLCESCDAGSPFIPSATRLDVMDFRRHPTAASPTLVELTNRLDVFKERRSQLMDQLHNLDLNYGATAQGMVYRPASPSWT